MKFRLIFAMYVFLFLMLIATGLTAVSRFVETFAGIDFDFTSSNHIGFAFSIFRTSLAVTLPLFGLFFRNRFGWFLITQYFYFILFNLIFSFYDDLVNDEWVNDIRYFLILIFFLLVNLGLLFIVNHHKIFSKEFHNDLKLKSKYNLISAIIGFGISIIFFVLKN
ncbi:hypothetical protein [Psychroserpens luteus]|uniref:Uncharacterized protein n=1 Tax=Psychroserpens luteus TaxID=1434066 RepID=A0ABW6A0M6_9FLAO|nr:hypothetical protein [Psychroserpens luteus]